MLFESRFRLAKTAYCKFEGNCFFEKSECNYFDKKKEREWNYIPKKSEKEEGKKKTRINAMHKKQLQTVSIKSKYINNNLNGNSINAPMKRQRMSGK